MPAEGFLQRFHDLAEVDEEVRCRAALGVRQDLEDSSTASDDLQYALRRLVRGVQSSRQCCRQGFSLALSELLVAFPTELSGVLDLIRQSTELQPGLKHAEMKDRLLGRLFAYAAVLQAGCLKTSVAGAAKSKRHARGVVAELGTGLHEIYAMRPYMKAPAARMLADLVAELVAVGMSAQVPELLAPWALEEKAAAVADSAPDVHCAALLLELRSLYVQAEKAGPSPEALSSWPACIRKDVLAKPPCAEGVAQAVGKELASAPLSDGLSWVAGPFCKWWLQASLHKEMSIWPRLHDSLFPEKATPTAEAQGFRALAELAARLHEAGLTGIRDAAGKSVMKAETLLAGLFQHMPRGLELLFRSLSWQKALTHPAAIFAQNRLVEAVGVPSPQPAGNNGRNKPKRPRADNTTCMQALPMSDETRLSILSAIQGQTTFGKMNGKYQRMWQQALLAPLSSIGVRARCTALLTNLASGREDMLSKKRSYADQLVQLATHSHAPDEVILAALCLLLTESYFKPSGGANARKTFSLQEFCSSVGSSITCTTDDLVIPVLGEITNCTPSANSIGEDEKEDEKDIAIAREHTRKQWRVKLWSALTGLSRRTSPEQAAKFAAANGDGDESGVKTFAFHGTLTDGSLWVMRLHEWWDYIVTPSGCPASPSMSPKKKKKKHDRGTSSGSLQCTIPLSDEDVALRKKCLECCRKVLAEPDGEGCMPTRQRNALCGLPLVLALVLLEEKPEDEEPIDDAEDEPVAAREHLQEFISIMQKLPSVVDLPESSKQRAKAVTALHQQRGKVLAEVPRIAAELFVQSNRLVKEAARICWRELSEYTSDETLKSLCGSVRDVDADDDAEDKSDQEASEEEPSDEENGEVSAAAAAKIARLNKATADLKAARAAEATQQSSKEGGEDDDEDDVVLDGDAVWDQLLEDGAGDESGVLASFASSGLHGADAGGAKLSKRQQRLRLRQEELTRKFREVELLDIFTQKCGEKRSIMPQLMQELFDALLGAARRAAGPHADPESEGGDSKTKKKTKANAQLNRMEKDFSQKLAGVLAKVLKQACRGPAISAASQWHSAEEWAERAQALAALASNPASSAAGQRTAEVGAVLLYWLCALHRAKSAVGSIESAEWTLGEKMLKGALQDWGSKKGSDKWCQAFLGAFAVRVPQALLMLPWTEHIRNSRNMYVQREQVAFVTNQLLRGRSPQAEGSGGFVSGFSKLCSELLLSTLDATTDGEKKAAGTSSQRQKMRREVLRSLVVLLRAKHKKGGRHQSSSAAVPMEIAREVRTSVKKVRDALPARRGEVYQLCLHVLRALGGPKKEGSEDEKLGRTSSPSAKRERPAEEQAEGDDASMKKSGKRPKTNAGVQTSKVSKGFFGEM
jgi:hypothetical protein